VLGFIRIFGTKCPLTKGRAGTMAGIGKTG